MKTVDIDLIGDFARTPGKTKIKKLAKSQGEITPRAKKISVILVAVACGVFVISFLIWIAIFFASQKFSDETAKLKSKNQTFQSELGALNLVQKNLQEEKKILDIKLLVQNQINELILPWHNILINISNAVPKNIKITEIAKLNTSKQQNQQTLIEIKGQVNANKTDALKLISYFVLNISDNLPPDSLLTGATVKEVRFNEQSNSYDFSVEVNTKKNKLISSVQPSYEPKPSPVKAESDNNSTMPDQNNKAQSTAPENHKEKIVQNPNYAIFTSLLVK